MRQLLTFLFAFTLAAAPPFPPPVQGSRFKVQSSKFPPVQTKGGASALMIAKSPGLPVAKSLLAPPVITITLQWEMPPELRVAPWNPDDLIWPDGNVAFWTVYYATSLQSPWHPLDVVTTNRCVSVSTDKMRLFRVCPNDSGAPAWTP